MGRGNTFSEIAINGNNVMSRNKKRVKRPHSKTSPRSAAARSLYIRLIWPVLAAACALAIFFVFRGMGPESALPMRTLTANAADPAQVAVGEVLYARHCASCHGPELEGQPEWRNRLPDGRFPAPPHDHTGHTSHHSDALLYQVTKNGGEPTARGWTTGMPQFAETLTDSEIWAVIAFIKSRWPLEMQVRQARLNH